MRPVSRIPSELRPAGGALRGKRDPALGRWSACPRASETCVASLDGPWTVSEISTVFHTDERTRAPLGPLASSAVLWLTKTRSVFERRGIVSTAISAPPSRPSTPPRRSLPGEHIDSYATL